MPDIVSAFQLGSSTVITLPKKFGIKPGQKLEIKNSKNGLNLKLGKKESFSDVLKRTQGAWADVDWEAYDKEEKKRREFELKASEKRKNAW